MAFPTIRVEAAFTVGTTGFILDSATSGVLDTSVISNEAWVDITDYARSFTVNRGATRAEGPVLRFEAATLSLELDNSDRRFDPTNTSGPYVLGGASQVRPMRQVRVSADYNGVSYPVFTGYADSWDISYEGPSVSICRLTATDATKVMADYTRAALGTAVGYGELSGARVHRVLDSIQWPVGLRDIDAGNSAMQATTLDGSAWDELVQVQDSEIGHLYVDARGYVVFRERNANMADSRSTQVQATFGDAAGEIPFKDLTIAYDDQGLYNLVRASVVGGAQQTAEDTTSRQQYLTHTYEKSGLLLLSDEEAFGYASFVLYQSKDPEVKFTDLTLSGNDDPALFSLMLGTQFGDRISVTKRPPGGGPAVTRESYVVGVSHSVSGPGEWTTRWALQSVTQWPFFVLNSASQGVLDQNALAF